MATAVNVRISEALDFGSLESLFPGSRRFYRNRSLKDNICVRLLHCGSKATTKRDSRNPTASRILEFVWSFGPLPEQGLQKDQVGIPTCISIAEYGPIILKTHGSSQVRAQPKR